MAEAATICVRASGVERRAVELSSLGEGAWLGLGLGLGIGLGLGQGLGLGLG